MNLDSMQEIVAAVRREGKPFWEIILETDMANRGVSRGNSLEKMSRTWRLISVPIRMMPLQSEIRRSQKQSSSTSTFS